MMMDVRVEGGQAVRAEMQRIGHVLTRGALDATAVKVEQYIEQQASAHHRTGALVQSVFKARDGDGWIIGHDERRAPYARFVVKGTRAHVIRPKNKQALRWAGAGVFHFAKQVKHPGYKGDDYISRAAALAPRQFEDQVRRMVAGR